MQNIIVKTFNIEGEEVRAMLEALAKGVYALADDYDGQISAYLIARIIFNVFSSEPEISEIVLPFTINEGSLKSIKRQPTFELCCTELLKVLYV